MTRGWFETKDPILGKARRHSEVSARKRYSHTLREPMEAKKFCVECGKEFDPEEQGDPEDVSCQECIDKRNVWARETLGLKPQADIDEKEILERWEEYLKRLDPHGRGFEMFGYRDEVPVGELEKIVDGGLSAVDSYVESIRELNMDYEAQMFKNSFTEFLKEEEIDRNTIKDENEFIFEFEGHMNYNVEKLFDYPVLLLEKKRYEVASGEITGSEVDVSDPEQRSFKKKALKYLTEAQFKSILNNTWGGVGYFGIIVNGSDIVEAVRDGEKTVGSSELLVGIHDWLNGSGYYVQTTARPDYKISLDNAMLDTDSYGVGGVFGSAEWRWR